MAHFAEVVDGVVQRVIVAENADWCVENLGGTWVQTSYNTFAGKHKLGGNPLHKNYAGIGSIFDGVGFHAPQPYPSWTLDEETYVWQSPTPMPLDGKRYEWNEDDQAWVELVPPTE